MIRLLSALPELKRFTAPVMRLASLAPDRLSLGQAVFFIEAARADLAGHPVTVSELLERTSQTISRSLGTTYQVFLEAEEGKRAKRAALGWLVREIDPADNRRKYLRLTAKGRRVVEELIPAAQEERETA